VVVPSSSHLAAASSAASLDDFGSIIGLVDSDLLHLVGDGTDDAFALRRSQAPSFPP
jgi:hypothetical protein